MQAGFRWCGAMLAALAALGAPALAAGQELEPSDQSAEAAVDPNIARGRELFASGAELVKKAHWPEALAAFEQSAKLRPHAVTQYNIGACLRAMGHYVRARGQFLRALERNAEAAEPELSEVLRAEIDAFLSEIDRVVVRLSVTLTPSDAAVAVDGRPLEVRKAGNGETVLLAGTLPAGPGRSPPSGTFEVHVDPGLHVFTLSRKGFEDAIVRRTFAPGTRDKLALEIARLPATLVVDANRERSVVLVDGRDVGFAPVTVSRPGGKYSVLVERDGFVSYETVARVDAGEVWRVRADLAERKPGLHERWWFWTGVGVVLTGAVLTTYFLTRPEPERPPPDGGKIGWVIDVP